MAVLNDTDRTDIWKRIQRVLSSRHEEVTDLTKADLRAAVDAVDQWIHDNRASYNTAIPLPARNNLTAAQKAELLVFVVSKRFEGGV